MTKKIITEFLIYLENAKLIKPNSHKNQQAVDVVFDIIKKPDNYKSNSLAQFFLSEFGDWQELYHPELN